MISAVAVCNIYRANTTDIKSQVVRIHNIFRSLVGRYNTEKFYVSNMKKVVSEIETESYFPCLGYALVEEKRECKTNHKSAKSRITIACLALCAKHAFYSNIPFTLIRLDRQLQDSHGSISISRPPCTHPHLSRRWRVAADMKDQSTLSLR